MKNPKLRGDHCQCPACGVLFNSTYAFDMHRTGPYTRLARRCLALFEMEAIGMSRSATGFWISSRMSIPALCTRKTAAIVTDPLPLGGSGV